jgi:hypothetical protein
MAARGRRMIFRVSVGVVSLGLLMLVPLAPASAQGIFESIFGGLRRAIEAPASLPANIHAYAPFGSSIDRNNLPPRAETGPAMAYCVRSCDGHYFPVQAHAGLSVADACRSFCPASKTRLYSGAAIDRAVAADGSRYADLDTAFLYRQQLVAGCTCNGRDPFGLAEIDVNTDPTLRPGDVVATKHGLVAFTGMKNKVADFTPVSTYRGLAKSSRDKLSELKIMPPNPGAPKATPVTLPLAANVRDDGRRSARLAR